MHWTLGNVWSVYHQIILRYYEHLLVAKKLYQTLANCLKLQILQQLISYK